MRKLFSAQNSKLATIGGAIVFGSSLLLIIGTLLAIYPCANLTATSKEPFVCRHLDGFQTFITCLSVAARLGLLALLAGGAAWIIQSRPKK